MTITVGLGALPRLGVLLTASCVMCGGQFRTVLPDEQTAARCGVDHRCGTGVVGPLWTLVEPPAVPARRRRPSVEAAAGPARSVTVVFDCKAPTGRHQPASITVEYATPRGTT